MTQLLSLVDLGEFCWNNIINDLDGKREPDYYYKRFHANL